MLEIPQGSRALLGLCLILFLAAPPLGCGKEEKKQAAPAARTAVVETEPAVQRRVVDVLEQVGTLDSPTRATMRSQVAASVAEILFREGAPVKQGAPLVRLDDAKIKADIRNLEARMEQYQVRLAFKKKTLERNRTLLKKLAIPQHQFDSLEAEVRETELSIAQTRAELARQKELLAETVVRAPFDGVAGAKDISVGDYLKAGEPVLSLVVLNPLEIAFQVPERYKPALVLNKPVVIRVASSPGREFEGTISFISPTVDVKTRTFMVKARVDNREGLLNPGMFARVELVAGVRPQAVTVPWKGVIQTELETYIYLLEDGKARKVVVRLGQVNNQWAEALDPAFGPGALVITEGKYTAEDGKPVEVRKATPAPSAPAAPAPSSTAAPSAG